MLTLINTNRMDPPIAPIGLDYIATTARIAGIEVDVIDLCLAEDTNKTLRDFFSSHNPRLVGLSFRNVDDCFWPSAQCFIPQLADLVKKIRNLTDAPVVLGGVGFSIFAQQIVEHASADFGIRGDGEWALISLLKELQGSKRFERVDGLIWRDKDKFISNPPAWPRSISLPPYRDAIDNITYFEKGGQCGLETKRGCNRSCSYCADSLAKGKALRVRQPVEVAQEVESLLDRGIDVLHFCDAEFNIPASHAQAVCAELIRRSLGKRLRWYAYLAVVPFDAELAQMMSRAGCVGINFTGDSACASMLKTYRQKHRGKDLALAVSLCRTHGITVMLDLLLGGPGETSETVAQTISFIKQIKPDAAGAALGLRVYPGTEMAQMVAREGPLQTNKNICRKYSGPIDFLKPTFYISSALGAQPDEFVRDLIAGDQRFFEPASETDHNYNNNTQLSQAIAKGARGAYWDILRQLRTQEAPPEQ